MHHEDLSDSVREFQWVRLISPEERSCLGRSFNVRASHTSKIEKSNNKVPASCNHSSSEPTAEQKINAQDNLKVNDANFPNPHMSVNNVFNSDANPWPKNTILIAGDPMINGINEKHISKL